MKISKKWILIAVLMLVLNMVVATQYAAIKIGYTYTVVHPSDASIRFIGSDNQSDGMRILRVVGDNITNIQVILNLGENFSCNMVRSYSAAFGIVNEESYPLNITNISVTSDEYTYLKIYLHGNRTANCYINDDPSSVLMWDNDTEGNPGNTTAWILAAGDQNSSSICSNTSDRPTYTSLSDWDNTSHVRYSINDSLIDSEYADYVWVQITLDIPESVDLLGYHTGTIQINLESDAS